MIKVLKFYSPTCAPCKVLEENLKEKGLESINVFENIELGAKYGIRKLPMLVFLRGEEEIHRVGGVISAQEFDNILNSL
jgi:thioredoxin-related protein